MDVNTNNMNIFLKKIEKHELELFKQEMVASFTQGVIDRFGDPAAAPVPPPEEVEQMWQDPACDVFIIHAENMPAGGAIVRKYANYKYSLDLLFIFNDFRNKKIGSAAWQAIEKHYPDAALWETFTPYFERRNIHFYLNKCNFRIVEFFNEIHREEHDLTEEFKDVNTSGFFRFEKVIKR